jgi:tetratricopeptide (TPR) repeat protein
MKKHLLYTEIRISFYRMSKLKYFLSLSLFLSLTLGDYEKIEAQNPKIDSLLFYLKTANNDTSKVNALNLLTLQYIRKSDYLIADSLAREALTLAEKLHFKMGEANSQGYLGTICFYQTNYAKSLEHSLKALKIDEELNNKKGISKRLGGIANVYNFQGNYPLALDYYFKAISIAEELEDKSGLEVYLCNAGMAQLNLGNYSQALDYYFKSLKIIENSTNKKEIGTRFSNIAIVYNEQGEYSKALEYDLKALKMAEDAGDKIGIASVMGNIGTVYTNKHDYANALVYHSKALNLANKLNDKLGIARHIGNLANIYERDGKYVTALDYYSKSLKISEDIGDLKGVATSHLNTSGLFISLHKYKDAYESIYKAIAIADSLGLMNVVHECYDNLSSLYEKSNIPLPDSIGSRILNFEQMRLRSLYYFKRSIAIRDTLFSQKNKKQLIQKEMTYSFERKEAATKAENSIRQTLAEEKNNKQKSIIQLILLGLLLTAIFAGLIFRSLKITRKQKQIIEIKNNETEYQKKIIEEKNKDITDSIHYAKQIQNALLREETRIGKHLPEHFILFLPKDIVSGDFYWDFEKRDYWYVAAADCTGHGVPGAIMSMLGISFLNDIVTVDELLSPAEILTQLRDRIISELHQTGEEGSNKDGMDISLIRLNLRTHELQWAGANNALNYIDGGTLQEIKADKQPIGYHPQHLYLFRWLCRSVWRTKRKKIDLQKTG